MGHRASEEGNHVHRGAAVLDRVVGLVAWDARVGAGAGGCKGGQGRGAEEVIGHYPAKTRIDLYVGPVRPLYVLPKLRGPHGVS